VAFHANARPHWHGWVLDCRPASALIAELKVSVEERARTRAFGAGDVIAPLAVRLDGSGQTQQASVEAGPPAGCPLAVSEVRWRHGADVGAWRLSAVGGLRIGVDGFPPLPLILKKITKKYWKKGAKHKARRGVSPTLHRRLKYPHY
jgi:hypothetical protein